jgi:hypothetical protein
MDTPTPSPFTDEVSPILRGEPSITNDQRADLFDVFHKSKDPNELARHLQPLVLPDDLKQQLYDKKKKMVPPVEPVDKVTDVVNRMKTLDPAALETAEGHPNVLKAFVTAATTPKEEPPAAAGASASASAGKAAKKPAPLVLPSRADGSKHMPSIPDGHRRVLASDGGVHDIPDENIDKAFQIDPQMHVLNPD